MFTILLAAVLLLILLASAIHLGHWLTLTKYLLGSSFPDISSVTTRVGACYLWTSGS